MIESQMMDWGYGGGYGMMGYGWAIFSWIFFIVFWVAIILLIIWLYKQIKGSDTRHTSPAETPLEILKKRYARGEITREQYEEMRKEIEK
jgi:putative membrane protein